MDVPFLVYALWELSIRVCGANRSLLGLQWEYLLGKKWSPYKPDGEKPLPRP